EQGLLDHAGGVELAAQPRVDLHLGQHLGESPEPLKGKSPTFGRHGSPLSKTPWWRGEWGAGAAIFSGRWVIVIGKPGRRGAPVPPPPLSAASWRGRFGRRRSRSSTRPGRPS